MAWVCVGAEPSKDRMILAAVLPNSKEAPLEYKFVESDWARLSTGPVRIRG